MTHKVVKSLTNSLYFIADVHIGNHNGFGGSNECGLNSRARETLEVLESVQGREGHPGRHSTLVIAGDLFDTSHPSPQMIGAVRRIFDKGDVIYLLGNHDMVSVTKGHNALYPLALDRVVDDTITLVEVGDNDVAILLPFRPGPAIENIKEQLASLGSSLDTYERRLLVLHYGLEDPGAAKHMRGHEDAVDTALLAKACTAYKITHVVAGNWHKHKTFIEYDENLKPIHMHQIGALCPTGFDNLGLFGYGSVIKWFEGALYRDTVPGPRFLKISTEKELSDLLDLVQKRPEQVHEVSSIYIEICAPREESSGLSEALSEAIDGVLADYNVRFRVVPSKAEAKAAIEAASASARQATGLVDTVKRYTHEMPFESSAMREKVTRTVLEYLAQ